MFDPVTLGDWINSYGLPITVCAIALLVAIFWLNRIWLPEMKRRSELRLALEEATQKLELENRADDFRHQQELRRLQEEAHRESIELTKTTRLAVERIQTDHGQLREPIAKLVAQHSDHRVGYRFETVTIKKAILKSIDFLVEAGHLTEPRAKAIRRIIQQGLPNESG